MRRQRGFTLIEVIVAAAVLSIAATALFSLLSNSLSNLKKIEDVHHYQLAGEDLMNRVLLLSTLPASGTIEGKLTPLNARWVVTVTPWIPVKLDGNPAEAVMKVNVEVFWPGRASERSLKLEAIKATRVSYAGTDYQQAIENALPN